MYNDDIIFDDTFFFGGADALTEEEWLESLKPYNEKYAMVFGYHPNYIDYHCTRDEYMLAFFKALDEKKELSEYLQKRTQSEE